MGEFKEPILDKSKYNDLLEVITNVDSTIGKHGMGALSDQAAIDLKHALNKYIADYNCASAYISNNDREFFGIYIDRDFSNGLLFVSDMRAIEENDNDRYKIDIDGKLFTIGLSPMEILTLIIYDTYMILSNEATMDIVSAVDAICAGRKETLQKKVMERVGIANLFRFAASDYLYRKLSICTKTENELIRTPQVLISYDLSGVFESAVDKLVKYANSLSRSVVQPSMALNWVFSIAMRYTPRSSYCLDVLNDFISITGSELIKVRLISIARSIANDEKHDIKRAIGEASLFAGIRKSGMRSLENDLFEYDMRVKNIDDEDSAIFLMRQINSRMSIIQDYLEEEKLSEAEMKRWQSLYDRYNTLRSKMTSKPIYSKKMYGLFTDYNALMQKSPENMMTMNTVY